MIWSDFHFYSRTLDIETAAYVLLPEHKDIAQLQGEPLPTLYLLHGLSGDHADWLRRTRIEQFAAQYALAVVMPAANRSFYTDMAHGAKYWTFVSEELPAVMETYFPLCKTREGRFAAGLSMGGYGAMKLGLARPERYAAIAALSAPMMMQQTAEPADPDWMREMTSIFGDEETQYAKNADLTHLADALLPADAPRFYAACGTADFLFESNEAFMAKYQRKFDIQYHTEPGASHTWDFWNAQIEKALEWLPLKRLENVW
jgi:putative tributyrin esterase